MIDLTIQSRKGRCGFAAVLAILFLGLITAMTVAMYALATANVQTTRNLAETEKARAAAESGLRWMAWRFVHLNRPRTPVGSIDVSVAAVLWPSIRSAIQTDLASMTTPGERTATVTTGSVTSARIAVDDRPSRFVIRVSQHPLFAGDALDQRFLHVTSTGTFGQSQRTLSMDFQIDKKVKFAIVGKVPIQLGRNTLVEGPIGMPTLGKYPPILALSDFRNLRPSLTSRIDAFNNFLKAHHKGYDGRVSVFNAAESAAAQRAGFCDTNGDNFIDEQDLFLAEFDLNCDKRITTQEFTNPSTGKLYDANLFSAMDSLGAPMFAGDPQRMGYRDGLIDNSDGYAKVSGQEFLGTTVQAWNDNLAGQGKAIGDMMQGPVVPPDANASAVKFGAGSTDIFDLSPANFDTSGFRARTGPQNGASAKTPSVITNTVLAALDANGGTASERTPYGSTTYQATYSRPVFRNITFKNCRISKGLNALFDNCKFEGVTYVELEANITSGSTTTTSASAGMTWSKLMKTGSFNASTALTSGNSWGFARGNNLRFNDCVIEGPIASDVPSAYTHFANSWEFTGATRFDNKQDQTATIIAPQTNIEMGSFTDPKDAPSTLVGVVVSGNIDIRGTSVIDGSIIVTGDGAGNTTLGWFGASDSDTDPIAMPEGGYGRLNVRYNPTRAMPDGINVPVDILPLVNTYREGAE